MNNRNVNLFDNLPILFLEGSFLGQPPELAAVPALNHREVGLPSNSSAYFSKPWPGSHWELSLKLRHSWAKEVIHDYTSAANNTHSNQSCLTVWSDNVLWRHLKCNWLCLLLIKQLSPSSNNSWEKCYHFHKVSISSSWKLKNKRMDWKKKAFWSDASSTARGKNQHQAWCTKWVLKSEDKASFQHHPLSESCGYKVQSLGVITTPKDS